MVETRAGWAALTEHGNAVLMWIAGEEKETDRRWERLEEVLSPLDS